MTPCCTKRSSDEEHCENREGKNVLKKKKKKNAELRVED